MGEDHALGFLRRRKAERVAPTSWFCVRGRGLERPPVSSEHPCGPELVSQSVLPSPALQWSMSPAARHLQPPPSLAYAVAGGGCL